MSKQFDVVVIGGGPGGYIAAIRAAQLGFNVACIDEWKNAAGGPAPGGTCTNVGCIPSKALLQSSEHFEHATHHFAEHGISTGTVKMDVAKMVARKDTVVKQNNDGILYLFKKNKVSFFHGRGSFAGAKDGAYEVKVAGAAEEVLVAKQVIIATGSNARQLPGAEFDEDLILSNDGALRVGAVPKKLGVIGSGVIGLEMGSVWRRLGAEVTILEAMPTFMGAADEAVAKEALKVFTKQGLKIELGVKIAEVKKGKKSVTLSYANAKGEAQTLEVDKLIVSIGRVPNTIGLNPEAVGLALDERGAVVVDADCKTNLPNVWAVGDVVRGPRARRARTERAVPRVRAGGRHGPGAADLPERARRARGHALRAAVGAPAPARSAHCRRARSQHPALARAAPRRGPLRLDGYVHAFDAFRGNRRGRAASACGLPSRRHRLARASGLSRRAVAQRDCSCGLRQYRPSGARVPRARRVLSPCRRDA